MRQMQPFSKRSPLYIFGAPARSETPPQNNYVALQRETPSLTTNMGIWQHGNSLEEFLKIEGMPILGFMLSIVKPTWMLASVSHAFLILSQTRSFYCTVKYVLLQYCSPIVCLTATFRGLFFFFEARTFNTVDQVVAGTWIRGRDCLRESRPNWNDCIHIPPVYKPVCYSFLVSSCTLHPFASSKVQLEDDIKRVFCL